MKTITIDFTKTPAEISDKILGHQGEHKHTKLIITPPAEMTENPDIISYSVAFEVGAHKVAHSEICDKADTITVLIERKVSKTNVISLQLEGYDGKEDLLVLSERITGLIFEPSAMGEEYDGGNESALAEQIAYIKNKIDGPITTVTLDSDEFLTNVDTTCRIYDISEKIPLGVEIVKIEGCYPGEPWFDFAKLIESETISPYYFANKHSFHSENEGLNCIAVIAYERDFPPEWTIRISNYELQKVRLTYRRNIE